ncbi:C-type lectin-like [Haliotis rubra]|uniref:C-type lectin-like n=1 Tax=Haliotis rubra TaxID=36100 RepID=UPI001EE52D22|nr:C-type lectin-like [Haliotis rubra]
MCRSDGATLVKIDTAEKQTIVRGLFNDTDYKNEINPWIGLRDTTRSNVYSWTDGSNATYTNWRKGEPNFQYHKRDEDCVQLILFMMGLRWNDIFCGTLRGFICEI